MTTIDTIHYNRGSTKYKVFRKVLHIQETVITKLVDHLVLLLCRVHSQTVGWIMLLLKQKLPKDLLENLEKSDNKYLIRAYDSRF